MNAAHHEENELDALLLSLSQDDLNDAGRARLEKIVRDHPEHRDRYLDYMTVDAMLHFSPDQMDTGPVIKPKEKMVTVFSYQRALLIVAAAAACLFIVIFLWTSSEPSKVRRPVAKALPATPPGVQLADWNIRPGRDSEIIVLGPGAIQLVKGELYAAGESELVVHTDAGIVRTENSRVYIQANMNEKLLTKLFVLAGIAMLSNDGGNAQAAAGEGASAENGKLPAKLKQDGNYREALEIYSKLIVDPNHKDKACALDVNRTWECLRQLGRAVEWDALIEEVVEQHLKDWRVLHTAAWHYWHAPHHGSMIDNQFKRATGGGRSINVTERDRIRALQLMKIAMPLIPAQEIVNDPKEVAKFYSDFANMLHGGGQLWNLQTLTDIEKMPDIGDPVYWNQNAAPPVDENDTPIYYGMPAAWDAAKNDGERWRWLLAARGKISAEEAIRAKLEYANFLHRQFGVHTSGTIGSPSLSEGQLPTEGRYATHTLTLHETIARLATGVRRFELPEGQRFIQMYREIASMPFEQPASPLRELTFKAYEGDFVMLPDFSKLNPIGEGKVESGLFDLAMSEKRDFYAIVFEGEIEIKEAGDYTFDLHSDEGSRLTIGDEFKIGNDGVHGQDNKKGTVKLEAGVHPIRLEYFDKDGEELLIATWKGPGMDKLGYLSDMRHEVLPQESALDKLAQIFKNRRQLEKAATAWRENIERFGQGKNLWKRESLSQIADKWMKFSNAPVFPSGKKVNLDIQFRNATSARFKARKVKLEQFIADAKAHLRSDPNKVTNRHRIFKVGHRIVVENEAKYLEEDAIEWTRTLRPAADHWTTAGQIETPLDEAGIYLVEATADDGNTSRILCWITNTSIVMKRGDQRHVYFVADSTTGEPVAKANVEVFAYWARWDKEKGRNYTKTTNFSKFTDNDGLVFTDATEVDDDKFSRIVIARDEKTGRFGILGDFFRERLRVLKDSPYVAAKAWAASDRPVYRPAQTVHLKAWIRQAQYDLDHVSLYGGREFSVVIRDPSGKEVFRNKLRTDEFGGLNFDWKLDEEAMLGSYRFLVEAENWRRPSTGKVYARRTLGSINFRVEEYKKPEYKVTIDAPSEPTTLGDAIEATVKAKYYFGAPVTNARVKYSVRRANTADTWFPSRSWDWFYGAGYWWWGYDYDWYHGWNGWCLRRVGWFRSNPAEVVLENTVPIGKDGTVKIKIDTAIAKERFGDTDHRYTITAEVVDESRRTVTGSGSVIAARNPFNVYVWMNGGHYRTGQQMGASFQARTPDGKGVNGKGKATLFHVTFDKDGKPAETEAGTWEVETNENGRAELPIKAGAPGQYRLSFNLTDTKGRSREGAALTRITGDDVAREDDGFRFGDLELVLDKAEYRPGDTARLLINTNRANSTIALFVRPVDGVYPKPKIIRLDGKSTMREIEIAKKDMPNIHVEAFTISDGQYFHMTREIVIPPEKRVLTLAVQPSEEKYEPGEMAKVKLRLTDADGKPFTGSTVVAIYDKSLEAIAGSQVRDIRAHFWKWRRGHRTRQRLSSSQSFGELLKKHERAMEDLGMDAIYRGWGYGGNQLEYFEKWTSDHGVHGALDLEGIAPGDYDNDNDWDVVAAAFSPEGKIATSSFDSSVRIWTGERGLEPGEGFHTRSRFADTALWTASVSTDENGLADIELNMPENLATWKIKAWAMGHGTRVGHGEAEVITSKDIMIRLQAPRFFTETDEVVLSANVHNYTGQTRKFDVVMEVEGEDGKLEVIDAATSSQQVKVGAEEDKRVDWRVRAVKEGQVLVRVKATASGDGKGDAMEQSYPVFVHGILKTDSFSVAVRDGQGSGKLEINVPDKRRPDQSHLEVRYSPSIALSMVDALPYLAGYPYKNSESAMSRFGPLVLTQKILKEMGVDLEAVRKKEINLNPQEIDDAKKRAAQWKRHRLANPIFDNKAVDALVQRSLRELTGMQNNDGGWGWYKGHDSSAHSTAYVVHGLQIAEANGAAIVPKMITRGLDWLEKHQNSETQKLLNAEGKIRPLKSSTDNTDAFVFMVLNDAERKNDDMATFLYRDRLGLASYSMAMAALAYDKLGDNQKRDMIIRNLEQFLENDDENQTAWLALRNRSWRWYWYGNNIEANAYYLKLLCRTGKAKEATATGLAKYLLNNRKHATYWNNTRDTAVVIEALAEFVQASGETDPDLEVEILVDGKSTKKVKITKDNLFTYDNFLELKGAEVTGGKHSIEIRRKGRGNLYANAYLTNFTLEDFITRAGLEIKVERRYYKVSSQDLTIKAGGSRGQVVDYKVDKEELVPLMSGAELKSGDIVEVELLLDSKNDYEYIQFSDRKPAGLEAIGLQSGHRWLGGVSAYMELRDEKVDFFVHRLRQGKHSLTYRLRAEVPGKFSALPARGEGVYAPELRANSDEFKVDVK